MNPKVSVVMSIHNEEKYIKKAVDSILNQTYEDYEFIIINDGSTDRTQNILESYTDNRLRIVKQENLGLTRSLNRGIKLAGGEYIARMDGNDISLPERFEKQVEIFNINKKVGLVGSFVEHIDENGNYIKLYSYPTKNEEIKKVLWSDCPLCHSSAMFRKECIEKVGYYREKIGPAEDYDMWFRISEHFDVENIADPLHKVRIKSEGISIDRKFDQIRSSLLVRMLADERKRYGKDNLDRLTKKELMEILYFKPGITKGLGACVQINSVRSIAP